MLQYWVAVCFLLYDTTHRPIFIIGNKTSYCFKCQYPSYWRPHEKCKIRPWTSLADPESGFGWGYIVSAEHESITWFGTKPRVGVRCRAPGKGVLCHSEAKSCFYIYTTWGFGQFVLKYVFLHNKKFVDVWGPRPLDPPILNICLISLNLINYELLSNGLFVGIRQKLGICSLPIEAKDTCYWCFRSTVFCCQRISSEANRGDQLCSLWYQMSTLLSSVWIVLINTHPSMPWIIYFN